MCAKIPCMTFITHIPHTVYKPDYFYCISRPWLFLPERSQLIVRKLNANAFPRICPFEIENLRIETFATRVCPWSFPRPTRGWLVVREKRSLNHTLCFALLLERSLNHSPSVLSAYLKYPGKLTPSPACLDASLRLRV